MSHLLMSHGRDEPWCEGASCCVAAPACACMYACMHVCMHTCMHVCMSVCLYVCVAAPGALLARSFSGCCHRVGGLGSGRSREIEVGDHGRSTWEVTRDRRGRPREIAVGGHGRSPRAQCSQAVSGRSSILNAQCSMLNSQCSILSGVSQAVRRRSSIFNPQSSMHKAEDRICMYGSHAQPTSGPFVAHSTSALRAA